MSAKECLPILSRSKTVVSVRGGGEVWDATCIIIRYLCPKIELNVKFLKYVLNSFQYIIPKCNYPRGFR